MALTVGDHEISNAELNYFYMSAINSFNSNYGSYAAMLGLDTSKPLNEQVINNDTGLTWADDFLNTAKDNARSAYALATPLRPQASPCPKTTLPISTAPLTT